MAQMINRYSTFLFIVLVLSLGFGQLLRFDFYSIPIYLHDILVICILVLHCLTCDWRSVLKRNSWLQAGGASSAAAERTDLYVVFGLKIFFAGLALGWLAALLHYPITQLLIPSLYTPRLLAYLALYVVIKKSEIRIPKEYFIVSALVCCFIGLLQYFFLPDMRIFQYLGWDDHLSRLTLPHFDPTFTAVMLSLSVLSLTPQLWFFGPLVFWSILLTYSRSTWLSLALTFGYFMLKNKKLNYLIIGICLLIIPILFLPKKFGEGTNLLRTYSISSRLTSDWSYAEKYKWDLLIGRGMNTLILDQPSSHATSPNNSYLYLLLTSGVLGLVGWGMFMWSLYQKSTHKPMLVFFFIASLFNNGMFYPFALIWVLLIESMAPTSA